MKLRNKKTGEIRELPDGFFCGDNLKKICEDWEDAPEELKGYWYIDDAGVIQIDQVLSSMINIRKYIGNYFETKEEAEKAVEKLRAWKRLKDEGFRFNKWTNASAGPYRPIWFYFEKDTALEDIKSDLDLLFGGEE